MAHPLLRLLHEAAAGRPPPPDGGVRVLPPLPGPVDAVLAFTAHHLVVADVDPGEVAARLPDGDLSAPMGAAFLTWLGGRIGGRPGSLDVVLAAEGLGGRPSLELLPVVDPERHPRAAEALRSRAAVEVWTTGPEGAGVLVLGRGLAGRRELAFEVAPERRNRGLGRLLVAAARHLTPPGEQLFAQVAPGNAASLRAVEAAGLRPLGAEVLFHRGN
jgi:GNAT superfamily N-acetyltransferase